MDPKCLMVVLLGLCEYAVTLVTTEDACPRYPNSYRTIQYRDKCYQFHNEEREWESAKYYCWERSGRLAMVNDDDTFNFLTSSMNTMHPFRSMSVWIGLNEQATDGDWNWIGKYNEPEDDLSSSMWYHWAGGNPEEKAWYEFHDKKCVRMKKSGSTWVWKNRACNLRSNKYKFICEYDLPPTTVSAETTQESSTESANIHILIHDPAHGSPTQENTDEPSYTTSPKFPSDEPTSNVPTRNATIIKDDTVHISESKQLNADTGEQNSLHAKVPGYVLILAPVATVLVLVGGVLLILRYKKKKTQEPPADQPIDVYLHTCNGKDPQLRTSMGEAVYCQVRDDDVNVHFGRPSCANDYGTQAQSQVNIPESVRAEAARPDARSLKKSSSFSATASPRAVPRHPPKNNGTLAQSYPTLAGSLSRGKLPALPTESGYEIPVSLLSRSEKPTIVEEEINAPVEVQVPIVVPPTPDTAEGDDLSSKPNYSNVTPKEDMNAEEDSTECKYKNLSGIYYQIPDKTGSTQDLDKEGIYQTIA